MATEALDLPSGRGTISRDCPLADLTWLRVGGPADALFLPADIDDLSVFLANLDPGIPVFPMGVGSNLIIRDGGLRAVVIRLGRGFNKIMIDGNRIAAGAAALVSHVARKAAAEGLDLAFLRTIPGSAGGALRMNAGCYGSYVADRFVEAQAVARSGETITLTAKDMNFRYRRTDLPEGCVITSVVFEAERGDADALAARMDEQLAKRDATQPTKDRTAGSTFRNPAGRSSSGNADESLDMTAWRLIDEAGLRGCRVGGAMMSEKHPNFLTNAGGATAADLEQLGEYVRKKVFQTSGVMLEWEVIRAGEP